MRPLPPNIIDNRNSYFLGRERWLHVPSRSSYISANYTHTSPYISGIAAYRHHPVGASNIVNGIAGLS